MTPFAWHCPYCNRDATITESSFSAAIHEFDLGNKHGFQRLTSMIIVCPNLECKEYAIKVHTDQITGPGRVSPLFSFQLRPEAEMKNFPDYIPKAILNDYKEACLIRNLSPKASATLARRCLQGMIRDFWGIKKGRLVDEIEAIQDKVDPITWAAIDAVRHIGNIGAHMEKDINLIIDVEPDEAQRLIGLIEMLIKDWYVAKHEREQQLAQILAIANEKAQIKSGTLPSVTDSSQQTQ